MLENCDSAAERTRTEVALGRKNLLLAGSDCGGERAATMYLLTRWAKLNGYEPELKLRTALARIAGPSHQPNPGTAALKAGGLAPGHLFPSRLDALNR